MGLKYQNILPATSKKNQKGKMCDQNEGLCEIIEKESKMSQKWAKKRAKNALE